jgi:hypothetical protein
VEIAPYKSYTRPAMETACAAYADAQRPTTSLRQTVRLLGGHPHPSALHGWLGGLGARALGRWDRHGQGPPVAALIAESAKGLYPQLLACWTQPHPVSLTKYRSRRRHDQLEACARLFDVTHRLFPQAVYPWTTWESWLESRFHVTAWGFAARFRYTPIQHHAPPKVAVPCAPSRPRASRRKDGKAHGARSPP